MAALIDTDQMRALGPVGGGPNAQAEMAQFVDVMPEAVYNLTSFELSRAYMQFWEANFSALYQTAPEGDGSTMVGSPDTGNDAERLATREAAAAAGEPPPPAPADADMEADPSAEDQVTQAPDPSTAPGGADLTGATGDAESSAPPAESGPPDTSEPEPTYQGPCFACQGKGTVPGPTEGATAVCNLCKGTGNLPAPA